jgi:prolipoprotein diacylglyceryltransferase
VRPHVVDWLTPLIGRDAALVVAPNWFTMVALAALVAAAASVHIARKRGLDSAVILRAIAIGYFAAVAGGIAGPIAFDLAGQWWRGDPLRLRWAGMTSWAGFAAGFAAMLWVVATSRAFTVRQLLDCIAVPCALALAVGRLGCFIAGCDFGRVSSSVLAMRFPSGSPAWVAHARGGLVPPTSAHSLPVHPTQLYELALAIAMAVAGVILARRALHVRRPGAILAALAGMYAVGRVGVEALRGDAGRGAVLGLSTGQWMSAVVLIALAAVAWRMRRVGPRAIAAATAAVAAAALASTPASAQSIGGRAFDVSGMLASSAPLNRRDDQVPQLAGFTITGTLQVGPGFGVGIDAGALANDVAVHRALLVSAEIRKPMAAKLDVGVRVGIGATAIDFTDEAFESVLTTGFRVTATAQYWVADNWAIAMWPMTVDAIAHRDIGGAIYSYQFRLGVSYGARPAAPTSGAATAPAPPPPPQ